MPLSKSTLNTIMLVLAVAILLAAMVVLLPTIAAPVAAQGNAPLGITPTPTFTPTPITSGTGAGPSIPEPTTMTLLGLGLAGLAGAAFKRRK